MSDELIGSTAKESQIQNPKSKIQNARIALVHDYLNEHGGAENVVEEFIAMFPDAPLYTSLFEPKVMGKAFSQHEIRTSFMQRLPKRKAIAKGYLPLYPFAFRQFDLSSFDIILSSASSFAKWVRKGRAVHFCYCHTPTRFVWMQDEYLSREGSGGLKQRLLRPLLNRLRDLDYRAAQRVDYFIANSQLTAERIRRFYKRDSIVINPPIRLAEFESLELKKSPSIEEGGYFLCLSRLLPYKRIDLAVAAANQIGVPLVVIGDGPERAALEREVGPMVKMLGRLPRAEVLRYIAGCTAFIFPGVDDFGITPIEVMAAGRPVIAYSQGGALETVVEGETGTFFHEQTAFALAAAMQPFDPAAFDPAICRAHAAQFDVDHFASRLLDFMASKYDSRH